MKKWAVWKTILVVIASVFVVSGATVGGVLLARGGNDAIYPGDISFVTDGHSNYHNGQFEVTEDFYLTITTNTPSVTEGTLELVLTNGIINNTNGTISDNVITVDRYVSVNTPFKVTLNKSLQKIDAEANMASWITGGISHLYAQTVNTTKSDTDIVKTGEITVAVDTPVYSIETIICDMAGNPIEQVKEGVEFKARANFYPAASKFMYNTSREKVVYFKAQDNASVSFEYDEKGPHFIAGIPQEENGIVGYAFKSAKEEEAKIDELQEINPDEKSLYEAIRDELSESSAQQHVESVAYVKIKEATVTGFAVKSNRSLKNMNPGTVYTLGLTDTADIDDFIGARIYVSDQEDKALSLLRNVAISFDIETTSGVTPATWDQLHVTDKTGEKDSLSTEKIDGRIYYRAKTEGIVDISSGYWQLYTDGEYKFSLTVVLLEQDGSSWTIYDHRDFTLYSKQTPEADVRWADTSDILITLTYDGLTPVPTERKFAESERDLGENKYRSVIYFAYFGDNQKQADEKANSILYSYENEHSGVYRFGNRSILLYALGESLTVKGTGDFEIYFATVQTTEAGYGFDADGKYVVVKSSGARNVKVTKTLNAGSILNEAHLAVQDGAGENIDDSEIYIYTGDENHTISVTFGVEESSWEIFKDQYKNIQFSVLSGGTDITSSYFDNITITLDDDGHYVTYTFTVRDYLDLNGDIQITGFALYDPQTGLPWSRTPSSDDIKVYFYTPAVKTISFTGDNIDFTKEMMVNQTLDASGNFTTTITVTLLDTAQLHTFNSVEDFLASLHVTVFDQHDDTEYFGSRWTYTTDNTTLISIPGQSFFFTNGNAVAHIYVSCAGVTDSKFLTLNISSVGIQYIKKEGDVPNGSLTDIDISKTGTKDQTITLRDLFNLYTNQTGSGDPYPSDKFDIRFIGTELSKLTYFDDLFVGENAMLSVFVGEEKVTVNSMRDLTNLTDITSIVVNNNFALIQTLHFNIRNDSGAIDINLHLTLSAGASSSASAMSVDVAAAVAQDINVTINHGVTLLADELIGHYSNPNIAYIVPKGNRYIISDSAANSIATLRRTTSNGLSITFNDFWYSPYETFEVEFFAVDNHYALSFTITYTVERNIQITHKQKAVGEKNLAYAILGGNDDIFEYFAVSRKVPTGADYESEREYLESLISVVALDDLTFTDAGNLTFGNKVPLFEYNKQSIFQSFRFVIKAEGYSDSALLLSEEELEVVPGIDYKEIANKFHYNDATYGKFVTLDGVSYVYLQTETWNFNYQLGNGYSLIIQPQIRDTNYNATSSYERWEFGRINFQNESLALKGLDDDTTYLIVEIQVGSSGNGDTVAHMIVPLIISNIGMQLVNYTDENGNTIADKSTIENALNSDLQELIDAGVYQEVKAGQVWQVVNALAFGDTVGKGNFGFVYNSSLQTELSLMKDITTFKQISNTYGDLSVTLNHLSNTVADCDYLGLQLTVFGTNVSSKTYYYVLKILPDVEVQTAKYAYDGLAEYVDINFNVPTTIHLDKEFSDNTLRPHGQRFNIKDLSTGNMLTNLKYTQEIVELRDETKAYTFTGLGNGLYTSSALNVKFDGDSITLTSNLTTRTPLTLIIKRVYSEVIGGEIEYTFKINASSNYSINYGDDFENVSGNNADLTIEGKGDHTFSLELQNGYNSVSGLHWKTDGVGKGYAIEDVDYNNGTLTVKRAEYVEKDTTAIVTFYTDQGYLGTLTILIKASGKVEFSELQVLAGGSYTLGEFIAEDGLTNDNEKVEDYQIVSVEADKDGDEYGLFFTNEDKDILIRSSIVDTTITLKVTLNLIDESGEHKYVFNMTLTVYKNIVDREGKDIVLGNQNQAIKVPNKEYMAGKDITLEPEDFIAAAIMSYDNLSRVGFSHLDVTYELSAKTGSQYLEFADWGVEQDDAVTLKTQNVPSDTPVEVLLKVNLKNGEGTYQYFYVLYSFTITPNAEITINYPNPTKQNREGLTQSQWDVQAEYLEDGATFANVMDLFAGTATFADGSRFVINDLSGDEDADLSAFTATVFEGNKENVKVTYFDEATSTTKELQYEEELNNENITNLTFTIDDKNGSDAYIIIRLTYNAVPVDYKIILKESVYSLNLNKTNGDGDNGKELLYVDYFTTNNNILQENRLVKMTFKTSSQIASGSKGKTYRAVFLADTESGYAYYTFTLTESMYGLEKYFDIGESATKYWGTYPYTSDYFDGEKIIVNDDGERPSGSVDGQLFVEAPSLTSRIIMTYAGTEVAYDKVDELLKFTSSIGSLDTTLDDYTIEPQNIDIPCTLDSFNMALGNGQSNATKTFATTYSYALDIDIYSEYDAVGKYDTIQVGQEVDSIIGSQEHKVIVRKSNKTQLIDREKINGREISADLEVVTDFNENSEEYKTTLKKYKESYSGIEKPYHKDRNYDYLIVSDRRNTEAGFKGTDFRLLAMGAGNDGNYVLLRFTYTVNLSNNNSYTKTMYFVYQVKSDYKVIYKTPGESDSTYEENGVPSNGNSPEVVKVKENDDNYEFVVAKNGGEDSLVKVVHSKDNNREVTASGFTYTLDVGGSESLYNLKENVKAKFGASFANNTGFAGKSDGWTTNDQGKTYTWKASSDVTTLGFKNVSAVVFGEQKYKLVAEDNYGYQFYVYFTLSAPGDSPKAGGKLTIREGQNFDIGAQFESLEIVADNKTKELTILPYNSTSATHSPSAVGNAEIVNLINIQAWGFDKEYGENGAGYLVTKNGNYEPNGDKGYYLSTSLNEQYKKYLQRPQVLDIKVTGITFTYGGKPVTSISGLDKSLATSARNDNDYPLHFVGGSYRGASDTAYTMPMLEQGIFGNELSVPVVMMVELTYEHDGNYEVYTVEVDTTVTRNYIVSSNANNIVRDGNPFELTKYLTARDANSQNADTTIGTSLPEGKDKGTYVTYYDDTLKVSLPANNGSVTLEVSAEINGNQYTKTYTERNSYAYARTSYLSLSKILGETLTAGTEVTVKVTSSGDDFVGDINGDYYGYYIEYSSDNEAGPIGKTLHGNEIYDETHVSEQVDGQDVNYDGVIIFNISEITVDVIHIENPLRILSDGLTSNRDDEAVIKYYLAQFTNIGNNAESATSTYQVAQKYRVSNYYYSFDRGYDDIVKMLPENDEGITFTPKDAADNDKGYGYYTIPRAVWATDVKLKIAKYEGNKLVESVESMLDSTELVQLYFAINTDELSSGAAEIDQETGAITTGEGFNRSEYISISIYVKSSGFNGDFSDNSSTMRTLLGTVRIRLDQKTAV